MTSTTDDELVGWVVPETWYVLPRDRAQIPTWASETADAMGRPEAVTSLLEAAAMFQTDDPTLSPFVVGSVEEPFIDATGWLRAWPGTEGMLAMIDETFAEQTAPHPGLHHFEIVDVNGTTPGICRVLYLFQAHPGTEDVLEERVSAFLVSDEEDLVRQVCFVTTDIAVFDDPVGLALEVLERSVPGADRDS